MVKASYTDFRRRLAKYLDDASHNRAPLRVSRRNGRGVVVMAESDYESLIETMHLLRSPANAERLLRSIRSLG